LILDFEIVIKDNQYYLSLMIAPHTEGAGGF
jgi:hypothetical protein